MSKNKKSGEYKYQKIDRLFYIYFVDKHGSHTMASAHSEEDAKKIVDALNMTLNK